MTKYQLKTFKDITDAVIEELKIQSTDTLTINRIKRDINMIYLDEVVPYATWYWLRRNVDIVHKSYSNNGSASVTTGSTEVNLTVALTYNKRGHYFKLDAYPEIYKIREHSGTSITLESPFTGTTNSSASYKIYNNGINLPVDIDETYKVWNDHNYKDMELMRDREYLELVLASYSTEGRPEVYRVTDFVDPDEYEEVTGLPALTSRQSSGTIKTLTFESNVEILLEEGDAIEITEAENNAYNGEFIIENLDANVLSYIGPTELTESPTSDSSLNLKVEKNDDANRIYKRVEIYPFLYNQDTTIHIEGIKRASALEDDTDEPLMAIKDRIVLLYGALHKSWSRLRNPEEASRNFQLFERKLIRMAGKIQDSTDSVNLKISRVYLKGKRRSRRRYNWWSF